MLANASNIDERRNKTFNNIFRSRDTNLEENKEIISERNNEIRIQRKRDQFKSKREEMKNKKYKDENMVDISENTKTINKELTICCNICKNIIKINDITNIDKIYKPNPFLKVVSTENLTDVKQSIDNLINKVKSWRSSPIKKKQLEETILLNRGSKQWGRAIVKNQEEIKVFKVKRTRRGKYIVIINKTPIDYKVFYVCLAILKIKQIDWFSNQWASILLQFNF